MEEKKTFVVSGLSNHEVQDILEELGMIDENGNCPYTAEEIFKAGVEYFAYKLQEFLSTNKINMYFAK